jgi:glucose dehydrogenase
MKRALKAVTTAAVVMGLLGAAPAPYATSTMKVYKPGEWTYWGGDAGQTRYAPLDQINLSNVGRLKIAWRWTADACWRTACCSCPG